MVCELYVSKVVFKKVRKKRREIWRYLSYWNMFCMSYFYLNFFSYMNQINFFIV